MLGIPTESFKFPTFIVFQCCQRRTFEATCIAIRAENGDEKMSALEAKICHQIKYYFGDFNLPWDKFLKGQIKLDEAWVPLEIMTKFNRLNHLTTDFNVIVEALSKSKAELMETNIKPKSKDLQTNPSPK